MEENLSGLQGGTSPSGEVNISRAAMCLLHAVRRRRNLMIYALATSLLLGSLYYATTARIYQSTASLLVMQTQPDPWTTKMSGDRGVSDLMDTYRSMLNSDAVLIEAVKTMQPEDRKDLGNGPQEELVGILRRNLTVTAVRKTNILELSYKSRNPRAAAMVIDCVMSAYLKFMDRLHKSTARELLDLLTREKVNLERELETKEQQLLTLKRQMQDVVLREGDRDVSLVVKRLGALSDSVGRLRIARQEAEADLQAIDAAIQRGEDLRPYVMTIMGALGNDILRGQMQSVDTYAMSRVREEMLQEQGQLRVAEQRYGPRHSKVAELMDRIRVKEEFLRNPTQGSLLELDHRQLGPILVSVARARLQTAAGQETMELENYQKEMILARNLQGEIAQLDVLGHDLDRLRKYYDLLVTRIKDIDITKEDGMLRTAVLSTPEIATEPIRPVLSIVAIMSLLAGLFGGLALVYFVEMLDDRFGSLEEMRLQLGGLPVLAMVPRLDPLDAVGPAAVHVYAQPNALATECFRTLRTALAFVGDGARSVVVTSSEPGDGKTTVILNTAAAMAQSAKRALLIDADMRRPKISPILGLRGPQGLSAVLRQETPIEELLPLNIHESFMPDLDVLPSGPRATDAAELLASKRLAEILSWAESRYEYIFIDSPPAFVSDAAIIGRLVDGVILTVRPEKNQRKTVIRTVDSLTTLGIKLLGLVVNHFAPEQSKYYGYEYGYTYGYSYDTGYGNEPDSPDDGSPAQPSPTSGVPIVRRVA